VVHAKGLEVAMHAPRHEAHARQLHEPRDGWRPHIGGVHQKTSIHTIGLCMSATTISRPLELVRAVMGWPLNEQEMRIAVSRRLSIVGVMPR
jgi:hypothetical protein